MYNGGIRMNVKPLYVTVVGSKHYYGPEVFKVGQKVKLIKDYDNPYDDEAIKVESEPIGTVGYVANSTHTVAKGTRSAGRIYDTFEDHCYGRVIFIVKGDVIVELLGEEDHEFI